MNIHSEPHPLAGQTVRLLTANMTDDTYRIEDWWDRVYGASWMHANGNPAALEYAMRSGFAGTPPDNEVVYGKVGAYGFLIHVTELGEVVSTDASSEVGAA